jgi:two-component system, OmpR family, sensor histidine kinase KdpD
MLVPVDSPRPDPDELLKRLQDEEARGARAKLKVFFGAAPGVGKTYAMLQEARARLAEGVDLLVGVVETHGRAETAVLVEGLPLLPRKAMPYRGTSLEEFDLEGALARHPGLILMDELAHTNVPSARHAKRWQDVQELLDAGIDVYTTVNVQHIESLRDVVAQITGVVVREAVPDSVLARADEVELVDLPPEELIQRLQEGKVYVPEQAQYAVQRFFRKGNLLALRELALRRTADHVDADMRRYMTHQRIGRTWAAGERLLVGISPRSGSPTLLRATKRMAESLGAPWLAAYVDTGRRLSRRDAERLEGHLRMAERLGAETVVLPCTGVVAEDLVALAVARNVTQIVVGKPDGSRWLEILRGSFLTDLVRLCGDIQLHVIADAPDATKARKLQSVEPRWPSWTHVSLSGAFVGASTLVGLLTQGHLELADIVMFYMLAILASGMRFGRDVAIIASALSVLVFDFFFIPPRYSLAIGDLKHLGTFGVMLFVGFVVGDLAERVRRQASTAQAREQRALALHRFGQTLVQAESMDATLELACRAISEQFATRAHIFVPGPGGRLKTQPGEFRLDEHELGVAQWAYDRALPAGAGTDSLPGARGFYLPLRGSRSTIGILGLLAQGAPLSLEPDQRVLLEGFANQAAMALERTHLAELSAEAQRRADQEELRNSLLSSVSHDLRTPLGCITGAASMLLEEGPDLPEATRRDLAETIHEEARRLHRLVTNLLEVTRLVSGMLVVKKEWVPAEELVGSALERMEAQLRGREVRLSLDPRMSLVPADPVLLEQVLINLLENAAKFAPPDRPIEVKGWSTERNVTLVVADEGPGIPEGQEERIFEKLVRLREGQPGAGLGLAICRGIVEAHGGRIQASNRPTGGAQFMLSLPVEGKAPLFPEDEA